MKGRLSVILPLAASLITGCPDGKKVEKADPEIEKNTAKITTTVKESTNEIMVPNTTPETQKSSEPCSLQEEHYKELKSNIAKLAAEKEDEQEREAIKEYEITMISIKINLLSLELSTLERSSNKKLDPTTNIKELVQALNNFKFYAPEKKSEIDAIIGKLTAEDFNSKKGKRKLSKILEQASEDWERIKNVNE